MVRPSGDSPSRYIGSQTDVIVGWQPVPWFSTGFARGDPASNRFSSRVNIGN